MTNKTDYILAAIADAQETIKAVDVKVGVLLAGLLIPLSSTDKIWARLVTISKTGNEHLAFGLAVPFFLTWFFACIFLIRTISGVNNPSKHIPGADQLKGSFYGSGIYKFCCLDLLIERSAVKANRNASDFSSEYPATPEEKDAELSFEHLKLIYIRDIISVPILVPQRQLVTEVASFA